MFFSIIPAKGLNTDSLSRLTCLSRSCCLLQLGTLLCQLFLVFFLFSNCFSISLKKTHHKIIFVELSDSTEEFVSFSSVIVSSSFLEISSSSVLPPLNVISYYFAISSTFAITSPSSTITPSSSTIPMMLFM